MSNVEKGRSPFYPTQPVPAEYFVGRTKEVEHILQRGVKQVASGKPIQIYVQGEYGIGKSSLARYCQSVAEKSEGLVGLYATLGTAHTMDEVGGAILAAAATAGRLQPKFAESIQNWLAKYVGQQSLFGLNLNLDALRKEGPSIANGPLPFLREVLDRTRADGAKGIFLILDEINGIAKDPRFAHFLKDIVDNNALSPEPLPFLLLLCGTPERRGELIKCYQPVERIFDIVEIKPLTQPEMEKFFLETFATVGIEVHAHALNELCTMSAGFPKVMQLLGDCAFWLDRDNVIDFDDAVDAIFAGAEDIGRKYVDHQVYDALQSSDYKSILKKLAQMDIEFDKGDLRKNLTSGEAAKLDNFLVRMKKLNVIRSGDERGSYVFNSRMVLFYLLMREMQIRST